MTIGTAMVASTKVRATGASVCSQSPRTRFRTVRVGKTASQIIRASWCLVGGAVGAGGVVMMSPLLGEGGEQLMVGDEARWHDAPVATTPSRPSRTWRPWQ